MIASLCETCAHCKRVVSGRGSVFLLCRRSLDDGDYPKYPPQPVRECNGFVNGDDNRPVSNRS